MISRGVGLVSHRATTEGNLRQDRTVGSGDGWGDPYLWVLKTGQVGVQVEHDAFGRPWQGDPTHQKNNEHEEREGGSDVHNLKIKKREKTMGTTGQREISVDRERLRLKKNQRERGKERHHSCVQ